VDEPRAKTSARRERTGLEILAAQLPAVPESERVAIASRVSARWHAYPFGSGQGDEIAFRAGLRPMLRELLPVGRIESARARYEKLGLTCELAPFRYGPTHDGWIRDPEPEGSETARTAMFVGRDRGALAEAAAAEVGRTDEASIALGRLLGYPQCCVTAFVKTSRERRAAELHAAALRRTASTPRARLNGLDLAVFHFLPWSPCSFECPHSLRYADALARVIGKVHPTFVAAIDRALARPRLVLAYEVQLSIDGVWDGAVLHVRRVDPTAADRHPDAVLDPGAADVVERALHLVSGARTISVSEGRLSIDGTARAVELPRPLPVLVPFA
jgi:hypothetical protein